MSASQKCAIGLRIAKISLIESGTLHLGQVFIPTAPLRRPGGDFRLDERSVRPVTDCPERAGCPTPDARSPQRGAGERATRNSPNDAERQDGEDQAGSEC